VTLPDPSAWPVDVDRLLDGGAVDLLRRRAAATPDRTALVEADTGRHTSYAEFDRAVDELAATLADHAGVGRRVGLFSDTRPAFAVTYFAVVRTGGAVVALNTQLPDERLAAQASRASVDLLVCDRETGSRADSVAPADVPVVSVDVSEGVRGVSVGTPESGGGLSVDGAGDSQSDRPSVDPVALPPDSEQVLAFTSGTTGEPKGVRLTRRNLVASAAGSADRLGVDPGDRWLVVLPMYHVGGLAPLVRSTLYGTTTVLAGEFDADRASRAMAAYDVTGVSLVPTMLTRLLDAGWEPTGDLRFVLLGGAPAPAALVERAVDRGVPVYPTYGTTETASQVATATPTAAVDYPGTVGRPLSVTDVSVLDGEDTPVDAGQRGELVVDGPTVTPGYLDAGRTDAAFGPAGFHTGDLGYRDDAGRLWVTGRLDDRIVTGGENVHPDRVAEALRAHEAVDDAAVVGLPDEEWGERVGALVVPTSGAGGGRSSTRVALDEHARDRLADYAVPKTVAFADSLPRTASGTVDRDAVRDRLRESDA
jgi:O-succinylbenzoic acid--CoA ligase